MPDIVGVGAVNVDYILDYIFDHLMNLNPSALAVEAAEVFASMVPGSERAISGAELEATMNIFRPFEPVASAGGSSLNTLASIAATKTDVSVGFVGVRSKFTDDVLSLPQWFADLGIDDQYILDSDEPAGVCISRTTGGERALKRVAPSTIICCDPGAMWTVEPAPTGARAVLELADWLFLVVLRPDQIVEDTGTGDAFAAGVLLSLVTATLDYSDGVELGFRLVREKLSWPGVSGIYRYDQIYSEFTESR